MRYSATTMNDTTPKPSRDRKGAVRLYLALLLLSALTACVNIPDTYAPPIQRKPINGPDPSAFRHHIAMNDPMITAYIVRDISDHLESGAWRWTRKRPTLRFQLDRIDHLKLRVDYTVAEYTMKTTGPVSVSFFVNEHLLDKVAIPASGEQHFEKPVPAEWLRIDGETIVAMEVDKVWTSPDDGAQLGLILSSAGFVD